MSKIGVTVSFVYNEDGLRTRKTSSTTGVTEYVLHGKNIVHLKNGSNELHFFYDAANSPAIVAWNNGTITTIYAYMKNLQGDIIALLDCNGTAVVEYQYDAWGRMIGKTGAMASTLGKLQPFRYRGHVYDEETRLHYLRSRYYKADVCRFINADSLINDRNLFAYCFNSPLLFVDDSGNKPVSFLPNCYTYAFKLEYDSDINMAASSARSPGDYYNPPETEDRRRAYHAFFISKYTAVDRILEGVELDGKIKGFTITWEPDGSGVSTDESWIIALSIDWL